MINREMRGRSCLIKMAVKAMDNSAIIGDEVLHRRAYRSLGIDISGSVMASSADTQVSG